LKKELWTCGTNRLATVAGVAANFRNVEKRRRSFEYKGVRIEQVLVISTLLRGLEIVESFHSTWKTCLYILPVKVGVIWHKANDSPFVTIATVHTFHALILHVACDIVKPLWAERATALIGTLGVRATFTAVFDFRKIQKPEPLRCELCARSILVKGATKMIAAAVIEHDSLSNAMIASD